MTYCCRVRFATIYLPKIKKEQIKMKYEIVNLEEKTAVGLCARTNNASPDMCKVIGGLWQKFYSDGIYSSIENKSGNKALGLYYDYEDAENGDYSTAAACEVTAADKIPEGMTAIRIPAGKYARFVVKGDMIEAVARFWSELWKMDINRSFVCDFEEYQNSDPVNAEIHIYIGIK